MALELIGSRTELFRLFLHSLLGEAYYWLSLQQAYRGLGSIDLEVRRRGKETREVAPGF